ncbi:hypothetical protein [Streptomyces caatingaensis]|uniref:hypothetical protein n=1 Tax=Streptomyces caatingaensis TaxID=1678637 RepID=UPI000A88B166|nr:hypothetical protein [Streptomyces caatingaensis]
MNTTGRFPGGPRGASPALPPQRAVLDHGRDERDERDGRWVRVRPTPRRCPHRRVGRCPGCSATG